MPRQKDVPSLFNLCGKSVEDALVNLGENFLINEHVLFDDYSGQIESCKMELCKIPSPLHDMLAEHCLKAADRIAAQYCSEVPPKSLKSQVVVQQLVSIVTHLKLKKLHFLWRSKPVQASLLNFLWKMTHLEILQYNHPKNRMEYPIPVEVKMKNLKKLQESLPFLSHLIEFSADDCTNEIITTLCENCKLLEKVNINGGSKVTDKSIDSLVCLTKLQSVSLACDVTDKGFFELLSNTQSENLVEIGQLAYFDDFLNILETDLVPFRTFQTQKIGYIEKCEGTCLPLISKYFPGMTSQHFLLDKEELPYFSSLDKLKHMEEVELSVLAHGPEHFELYSLKSQVLTSLTLLSGLEMRITGLISVGLQCPNVTHLELEDCSFVKDVDFLTAFSLGRPFQKLKSFSFYSDCTTASGAELILALATNIEDIHIADNDRVPDVFITSILKYNALEELRYLGVWPGSLSLNIIKFVILNCKKLATLRTFAPSEYAPPDSTLSKEEFESLQKFISENNYNIKLE